MAPHTSTEHHVDSVEKLRELYRDPSQRVKDKKAGVIDDLTRQVIEASPFFLLATASPDGACDVSPRGGPAGQLIVLDESHVAFPDLSGNNLLDSLENLITNPHAGLLVLTPGRDETLRIDGAATLSTDPELLGRWDDLVRRPKVAVVIDVANTFLHCAKAFQRSGMWDPQTWESNADLPDHVELFLTHTGIDADPVEYRAAFDAGYQADLAKEQPA